MLFRSAFSRWAEHSAERKRMSVIVREKVRGGFGHLGVTVPDVYEACVESQILNGNFTLDAEEQPIISDAQWDTIDGVSTAEPAHGRRQLVAEDQLVRRRQRRRIAGPRRSNRCRRRDPIARRHRRRQRPEPVHRPRPTRPARAGRLGQDDGQDGQW